MFDVLLVEDNQADVLLVHEALTDFAPAVCLHVVDDGEQALAFLRRAGSFAGAPRPHLMLLDGNTPRRNAVEVLRELRGDPELVGLPVVVFSTSAAATDIERSLSAGADGYVEKPLGLGEFLTAVQDTLRSWLSAQERPCS
ncbi:response regulator [Deinococcus peraridilitoris]|uniref:Response regulator with CheY-like receiver domain and winged-helix DNA-binding domain protein n=1 Tax=Deinococcus peraridilitoris (strain DSM 19664 / LMG 22246 / CIP 109416 / KR-200) TaxID=937777 RepID=L0A137_DEIPD|nr:response regulator [Deinococcus peraridilitoris]AFZ67159.1 response regulator with CheY-like receiver domain and winged-helix DNA-binding domain protein [Deinococcus peraridilitoris DSM 19664]